MNLFTVDEHGWATFYHQGRLTTVSLFTAVDITPVDLDASTLKYYCRMIANLTCDDQNNQAPLQITAIDTINDTITFSWRKTQEWTFNTITFLTQAAPELVSVYRQSILT